MRERDMNENDNVRLRQMNWNGWLNHTLNYKSSAISVVEIAIYEKDNILKAIIITKFNRWKETHKQEARTGKVSIEKL